MVQTNQPTATIAQPAVRSHMEVAAQQIGLNEREQRAALQEFMANGGVNLDPAVTAWCAAFVNATLAQSGMEGTGALNARSFMNWGEEVTEPQRGDIAVFSRGDPNGWQGHVGFFDGYDENGQIRVLGGNQSDAVSIASYDPSRLLGFRRAVGGGIPDPQLQNGYQPAARSGPAPQEGDFARGYQPISELAGMYAQQQPMVDPLSLYDPYAIAQRFGVS